VAVNDREQPDNFSLE